MYMSKIFISHSRQDEPVVTLLVKTFLLSCGLSPKDIFYTSVHGTGCTGGEFFNEEIKKNFKEASVIVAYLSKNYRASEYCMAELGAIWICSGEKKFVPLLDDASDKPFFKGVLTGCTLNLINDDGSLFDGVQCILETLELEMPQMSWINDRIKEFLNSYPSKKAEVTQPFICDEESYKKMEKSLSRYRTICEEQSEELKRNKILIESLEAAKSSEDVLKAKLNACEDEMEMFETAVQNVHDSAHKLDSFMTKYVIYDYFNLKPLYPYMEYSREFDESVNKGYLLYKDEEYFINNDDRQVKKVQRSLNEFCDVFNGLDKSLISALEEKYDVDLDLYKSTCLDAIFSL